jgi:hypothetical protein
MRTKIKKKRFRIELEAAKLDALQPSEYQRLRRLLKFALRVCDLRCVAYEEVKNDRSRDSVGCE